MLSTNKKISTGYKNELEGDVVNPLVILAIGKTGQKIAFDVVDKDLASVEETITTTDIVELDLIIHKD